MELFIFESFVFEQKALYRADFLSVTSIRQGWARDQNLGILRFFFFNKPVFMSFSDAQGLFLDIAILVQISTGSLFLHLMTIGASTVHS